jgi:serine protease Do
VNTAILSPTGYSVGISFSVPAELAESVVEQLIAYGETRRGYLGVRPQKVSPSLAKAYGLKDTYGALVTAVIADSPADKAGLQKGDLITEIGGERLESSRLLSRRIAEAKIGEETEIKYVRKRKTKTAMVLIERLKEQVTEEEKARREKEESEAERSVNGIYVEALTDETRKEYRIDSKIKGVRVVKVDKRAEASGKILIGDIIEEVGFEPVETPKAFEEAVESSKAFDSPVTFLINRGGNYIFYALTVTS